MNAAIRICAPDKETPIMKYVDEFRDPDMARSLLREIERLVAKIDVCRHRPLALMEVCGGHTHAIFKFGIETMLPDAIELVHGPGCPVCVLPMGRVDDCIALAETPGVIFTTFGDAMRVPGSKKSLMQAKAEGADVRMVYSPLDALALARKNPEKEIVFFGLGFETTMPSTALTILQAEREAIGNFSLFCNHITIIPTIKAILDSPEMQLDGFLGPGHVSMVIGTRPYRFICEHYRRPMAIAGFEPLDVLQSVWMVLKQIAEGRCEIENQYNRVVPEGGNRAALSAVARVFELREFFEWRGLGSIDHSGVRARAAYARYDAERKFSRASRADRRSQILPMRRGAQRCHQTLGVQGVRQRACTPEKPLGALMVSSEGACAAYYQFGDIDKVHERTDAA
jgi:hydrogenase expression/formation protein HypD